MADEQKARNVRLDLNAETFQKTWLELDKSERDRVTETLRKLRQLTWDQVYRDPGLKWEKVSSVKPPHVGEREGRIPSRFARGSPVRRRQRSPLSAKLMMRVPATMKWSST